MELRSVASIFANGVSYDVELPESHDFLGYLMIHHGTIMTVVFGYFKFAQHHIVCNMLGYQPLRPLWQLRLVYRLNVACFVLLSWADRLNISLLTCTQPVVNPVGMKA